VRLHKVKPSPPEYNPTTEPKPNPRTNFYTLGLPSGLQLLFNSNSIDPALSRDKVSHSCHRDSFTQQQSERVAKTIHRQIPIPIPPVMAAGQYHDSSDNQAYMMTPEMSATMYDGTSSESSASSPLNCNVSSHPLHGVCQIR
jgi:hypothetical protein